MGSLAETPIIQSSSHDPSSSVSDSDEEPVADYVAGQPDQHQDDDSPIELPRIVALLAANTIPKTTTDAPKDPIELLFEIYNDREDDTRLLRIVEFILKTTEEREGNPAHLSSLTSSISFGTVESLNIADVLAMLNDQSSDSWYT